MKKLDNAYKLNFFKCNDKDDYSNLLADYFNLDKMEVRQALRIGEDIEIRSSDFIELFNIDLRHKCREEIFITCRHGMTSIDNLKYLKSKGLLNLNEMLKVGTPLSLFLKNYGIEVDVNNRILKVDEKIVPILHRNSQCSDCIFEKYECRSYFNNNNPDFKSCEYRKKMSFLELKLYYDKCETEVFIDGTNKDIEKYSIIGHAPEILYTIDNVIKYLWDKKGSLEYTWWKNKLNKFNVLEFDTSIEGFELINTKDQFESYEDIYDELENHNYDELDFEEDKVSKVFYQNLFILRYLLGRVYFGKGTKFGQLLPSVEIEPNNIIVEMSKVVNEVK